ncbi:MAG: putative sugar O-methyltransferase [Zavarzinella sp.]|nr:putative sugar O-methyltransferase [Zavarzinella sp.]
MDRDEYAEYVNPDALHRGLQDRPDPISDEELAPTAARLCRFYRDLKAAQADQPDLYLAGGEWREYLRQQERLYAPFQKGDIAAASRTLRHFWRNEHGSIVKQYAGFDRLRESEDDRHRFTEWTARDYMLWRNLLHADPEELTVPRVGNPWGYYVGDVLIAPKALRYHVLATQIREITADVARPVVAEIGAGYGGTAHYLMRGDWPATYVDFDLPEVLLFAAYYLVRTLPHRRVLLWEPGVRVDAATLAANDVVLCPNWELAGLPAGSVDLFLNTFSLSEMPPAVIEEYVRHIERACRGYFLYNNMDRPGVVNRGHQRVPCSRYPISPRTFKTLYKRYDLFQERHSGRDGDYREVLLQRIRD